MDEFQHLDDYAVLGIEPGAAPDDIKRAYRREIAKYHPDRFRAADPQAQQYARARSQRITEAYAAITRNPRTHLRPANTARRGAAGSAEQLAAQYDQARTLLATGRPADAARLLHDIQRVDPLYRDVDELLAQAEAAGMPRRTKTVPPAWVGAGLLALVLIGVAFVRFGDFRAAAPANQPVVAEASGPTDNAGTGAGASAGAPVLADASASASVAGATSDQSPNAAAASAGGSPTEVPPTAIPPTEAPPPPTEAPPPPTEAPPPPTEAPPTSVPAPTAVAAVPTARPVTLESGAVLVADDFSDSGSGWATMQAASYTIGYRNGVYAITSDPGAGSVFSYGAPLSGGNVIIGADATPVRGAAGLIFGPDNSYRFLVSADGRFRVEQRGNAIIASTASSAIRAGTNRLVIAAAGRRVSLYANGTLLANLDLSAPLAGATYGFVVSAGARGGEGVFDNLTVRALPR